MDISALRQGLADAATRVEGLNALGYAPDAVAEPVFYPEQMDLEYRGAGDVRIEVTCWVLVSRTDDKSSQAKIDAYISPVGEQSIKRAVETDRRLGGACHDLIVRRVSAYRWYTVAEINYIGAEITVEVIGLSI